MQGSDDFYCFFLSCFLSYLLPFFLSFLPSLFPQEEKIAANRLERRMSLSLPRIQPIKSIDDDTFCVLLRNSLPFLQHLTQVCSISNPSSL
jgi:hypothetical protein